MCEKVLFWKLLKIVWDAQKSCQGGPQMNRKTERQMNRKSEHPNGASLRWTKITHCSIPTNLDFGFVYTRTKQNRPRGIYTCGVNCSVRWQKWNSLHWKRICNKHGTLDVQSLQFRVVILRKKPASFSSCLKRKSEPKSPHNSNKKYFSTMQKTTPQFKSPSKWNAGKAIVRIQRGSLQLFGDS